MKGDILLNLNREISIRSNSGLGRGGVTYLEEYQAARKDVELPQWTIVVPQVVSIEEQALVNFGDIETFVDLRPTCIRTAME